MTQLDLIQKATKAAYNGDIDTVESCFDLLNDLELNDDDRFQVGCIIAECSAIADAIRA